MPKEFFSKEEALNIGNKMKLDWAKISFNEFWKGLNVELEHGSIDILTNVTNDDPVLTAKIALAHINELPDYYARLEEMEEDGKKDLIKEEGMNVINTSKDLRAKASLMLRKIKR
jgi:hypothetical protein